MDLSDTKYPLYTDKEGFSYFMFQENTLYSWDIEALADSKKPSKPTIKKLEEAEAPKAPANFTNTTTYPSTNTPGSTSSTTTFRSEDFRIPLQGDNDDPFAGVIGKDRFDELAKYGCTYCGEKVNYNDNGITIYYDQEIILGKCCTGGRTDTRVYVPNDEFEFLKKAL
jgi:hypothetical protein